MYKIIEELQEYEPQCMTANLPVVWDRAKGSYVWDIDGKKYIDFTSCIFVTNCGHGVIAKAIKSQVNKLIHSYTFANLERLELLKTLFYLLPEYLQMAFFLSAGTEATECACKLMFLNSGKDKIISFKGSMHGKTLLAEMLKGTHTSENIYLLDFPEQNDRFIPPQIDPKEIAGFMIESYQGWSARFYPKKYIQKLVSWSKSNNILVCFDEVQGGFGRTGKLFAYQHYEVEPDLVCIGKGFGGGVPISGVLGRRDLFKIATDLTSTHSANPLCCTAATANINYLVSNNLIKEASDKGKILKDFLIDLKRNNDSITEINCKGLLGAILFKNKTIADLVCIRAMEKGLLLVHTNRESVKLGPPLSISIENLNKGLKILKESVESIYDKKH